MLAPCGIITLDTECRAGETVVIDGQVLVLTPWLATRVGAATRLTTAAVPS